LGAIALHRRPIRDRWLLAAAAVGCLAFSIREFAIAAPASVVLGAICAEPRRLRHWGLAIAVIGCFALLYLLKSTFPGQGVGGRFGDGGLLPSTYALSSVSLLLLVPAVIGSIRWRHEWKRRDVAIGAELGLLIVGIRVVQWFHDGAMPPVLMDSLASQWGAPGPWMLIGGRPLLFSNAVWAIVGILALGATVVVLAAGSGIAGTYLRRGNGSRGAVVKQLGSPLGSLVLFSLAVAIGLTVYGFKFGLFDRYYWPLIPAAAISLMYSPHDNASVAAFAPLHRKLAVPVTAIFAIISIVSLIFMLNSFAFDSARWRAGEHLVELGVSPEQVDAGYEWVGNHQRSLPVATKIPSTQTAYDPWWPGRLACGIVSSDKEGASGGALVGTLGYSLFLIAGPQEVLYLYRVTSPDCLTG
jgi:hypothetical protein